MLPMPFLPRMPAWGLTLLVILAWGLFTAAAAQEPDPGEEPWLIDQVVFAGFSLVSPDEARQVMETKLPGLLSLRRGPVLDEPRLERDRLRLQTLYLEHGFFEAEVAMEIERHPHGRRATVTFTAQENRPAMVEEVRLLLPSQAEVEQWGQRLHAVITLAAGKRLALKDYQESKDALGLLLANQAHPQNRVDGQVQVYPQEGKAVVVFQVEPGPRVLFGPSEVKGPSRPGPDFILRQLTYVRGQPYSQSALEATQRRLLDSGFFSSVSLTPDFERMDEGQAPIVIEVKEAKHHSVRLGLGWGPEDQYRVRILQVNRDLLGLSDTLTFEGKISAIYQGLVGRLKLPEKPGHMTDTLLNGGVEQKNNQAFENRRLFVNPLIEYRLPKRWSWFFGYNLERNFMLELKAAVPDPAREKQQLYISSLPVGLKYDSRDSLLDPKEGTYFALEVEAASDLLGSEVEFLRPQVDLRHVLPLAPWRGWFLASRAKAGLVYPLSGLERIPLIRRYFPGGADSVRGYPYQGLGPLDSAGKPLGGEAMVEASLELRYPIWGDLGGVAFVDAGNAYERINSDMGALRFTAGVGLRYQTPVGPIRLDFGYQLNPPDNSPQDRYEIYLSVGQAF